MHLWYMQYKGRSLGRILKFLNAYCGLHIAEMAQANDKGGMNYYGEPFCEVEWDEHEVPVFKFLPQTHNPRAHESYMRNQKQLRQEVLDLEKERDEIDEIIEKENVDRFAATFIWLSRNKRRAAGV